MKKPHDSFSYLPLYWFIVCIFATNVCAKDHRFLLDLYLNDIKHPVIIDCFRDPDGALWLRENDLKALSLKIPPNGSRIIELYPYYCLYSYKGITWKLDPQQLTLHLTIPPEYFSDTRIDLSSQNFTPIRPIIPGGFFNYDLSVQHTDLASQTNAALVSEIGYFNPYGIGTCDFYLKGGRNLTPEWVRLNTTWTLDQPEKITTWNIGDSISSNISWSGAVRFAGIQWQTNFNTQPYLVTFPLPTFSGQAVVPTTVSVFVNDALNVTEEIQNGPFSLYDIPVITGAGTVKVVTNDLLGRQRETMIPYYSSQQLLKKGLIDFSYEIGIIRDNYGIASADYSEWMGVGTYQKGLTDTWTAGWHIEGMGSQQTIGVSSEYLWHDFLVISSGIAVSHSTLGEGGLVLLGIQRQTPNYTIGFQVIPCTSAFTVLGFVEDKPAPRIQLQSYFTLASEQWGSWSTSYTWIQNRVPEFVLGPNQLQILPDAKLLTMNYSHNVIKNMYFVIGAIINFDQSNQNIGFLSWIWGLKNNRSLSATTAYQNNALQQTVLLNKDVPWGNGAGYHASFTVGNPDQSELFYTYQNDYGTYAGTIAAIGEQKNYLGEITGSIVRFGGHWVLSRALYNSFALVEIPGFDDLCVYNRNTCIGRTHSNGILLVPNILPYQNNRVALDLKELPLNTEIATFEQEAIPYYRSGVLMSFPVKRVQNSTFQLRLSTGHYVPIGAFVTLHGASEYYPVVDKGVVFVSHDDAPYQRGVARWGENEACTFTLVLPPDQDTLVFHLGEIPCHSE